MSEPSKSSSRSDANAHILVPITKAFPSFEVFERKLLPELWQIHELLRPSFLFRAYELAKRKMELEESREHWKTQAKEIRASRRNHKKISTQLRKAIAALNKAAMVARKSPELLKNLGVLESRRILSQAEAELRWLMKEMLQDLDHPKLRNENLEPTHSRLPEQLKSSIPGFGFAQIDYWFIGELDKYLDSSLNKKGAIGRIGRDRIITKVFKIAFGETHQTEQIKNARIRMTSKRKKSAKK